jgi:alpha-D-xyloside xylohydrolase
MVTNLPPDKIIIQLNQHKSLRIQINPLFLSIHDEKNESIWSLNAVRFRDIQGKWHQTEHAEILSQTTFLLSSLTSPITLAGTIIQEEKSFCIELKSVQENTVEWVSVDFNAEPDEHYLGLGERFDQLDQRGNQVVLKVVNGASGGKTYKPIPFYISSKGYGVQLLTSTLCLLRLATPDDAEIVSIRNQASSLKFRLFTEGTSKDILTEYTSFCGRQAIPPAWVFGPWKSRDWTVENQKTAEEDITQGRIHHLAGTVKLIDAAWEPYMHSFTFDEKRWPDPVGYICQVHQLGYRLILWISPWLVNYDPPSPMYAECARRGFFIKNPDGEVYIHRLANSPDFSGSCFDFTNPEARTWWQEQIRRLARMGVDGFKTDFGEQVPEDAIFFDGRSGHEMHNLYPVLYNHATYESLNAETHGVLLARSAWDGSQPYCMLFAGDQSSDFGPATGLPSVLIAGQNAGLSGFPFWTCDIGGYFGTPTEDVFIRWAQFGAFTPIMQVHGLGKREPWSFSARTLAIYRRYAQIHMDLFPYIYTYAKIASETGLPIIRALPLEFPNDAGVWGDMASHEYCLGEALLVAPDYFGSTRNRHTYLPKGAWRDFWTGTPYQGEQIHALESPIELIPVVVRAGSIIPFLDPSAETLLPVEDPTIPMATNDLRLQIYPGMDGQFTLYDGTQFEWVEKSKILMITNSPVARWVSIKILAEEYGLLRMHVTDEHSIPTPITQGSLNHEPDFYRFQANKSSFYSIQWK